MQNIYVYELEKPQHVTTARIRCGLFLMENDRQNVTFGVFPHNLRAHNV